ncbi:hypothetical protein ACQKWADRAFT_307125, partial [Trichoderma austrokoningii]
MKLRCSLVCAITIEACLSGQNVVLGCSSHIINRIPYLQDQCSVLFNKRDAQSNDSNCFYIFASTKAIFSDNFVFQTETLPAEAGSSTELIRRYTFVEGYSLLQ